MTTISREIKPIPVSNLCKFEIGKTYSVLKKKHCYPVKVTKIEHKEWEDYITVVKADSPTKTEYTAKINHGFMWGYGEVTKSQNFTFEDEYGNHTIWAWDKIKEEK